MTPEKRRMWMAARVTHGEYVGGVESAEHAIWRGIVARCTNPSAKDFSRYGGVGVDVCPLWVGSGGFERFLACVGRRPSKEHSIDRIDPMLGYVPDNVRWATRSEQQRNKRTTKRYVRAQDGFIGTLVECALVVGISKELAHWRWANWATFNRGEEWQLLSRT